MTKEELLSIVEAFASINKEDSLLLASTKKSIDTLFAISIKKKSFLEFTVTELIEDRDALIRAIDDNLSSSYTINKLKNQLREVENRIKELS